MSPWGGGGGGENGAFSKLLFKEVAGLIDDLPDKYRLVYKLHFLEGMNFHEISNVLKMNENTVRTRLRRAVLKLNEMVEDEPEKKMNPI